MSRVLLCLLRSWMSVSHEPLQSIERSSYTFCRILVASGKSDASTSCGSASGSTCVLEAFEESVSKGLECSESVVQNDRGRRTVSRLHFAPEADLPILLYDLETMRLKREAVFVPTYATDLDFLCILRPSLISCRASLSK